MNHDASPDVNQIGFHTLREKALATLRIYGPAPNIQLARAAGMGGEQFHGIVFRLRQQGLAIQAGGNYDVTPQGRQVADGLIESRSRQQTLFEQEGAEDQP